MGTTNPTSHCTDRALPIVSHRVCGFASTNRAFPNFEGKVNCTYTIKISRSCLEHKSDRNFVSSPVQTLEKVPELAPFVSDGDVGEEFVAFYSQMKYPTEQAAPTEQLTNAKSDRNVNSLPLSGFVEQWMEKSDSKTLRAQHELQGD
ncbi:hypothetical protein SBOR_0022 [Sclerotinia borealis F-4128]|uniref:Uncharacterized protein n=1 Tax=Sclerotinia borealis (strain F-4128) TaxID=1432307 RepID=W9CUL9_SCLBF|nr:hypothetical protein SBOR_0022 [Sclerotinia borealis F-4128]